MTEEEWLQETSVGTMLEAVRRWARLSYRVADRKYRLTACGFFRLVAPEIADEALVESIEACERYVDGEVGMGFVGVVVARVANVAHLPTSVRTLRDQAQSLVAPAPFFAARGSAYVCDAFVKEFASSATTLPRKSINLGSVLRDIFGNPFRPVVFDPDWRTTTAVALARQMYDTRDFAVMPILADALQDAGCENPNILDHCRNPNGEHVRGCWVVDEALGLS